MVANRKYDTEALVGQIHAQRRMGLTMSLGGVLVLFFLGGIYFSSMGSPPDDIGGAPPTPQDGVSAQASGAAADKDVAEKDAAAGADKATGTADAEPAADAGDSHAADAEAPTGADEPAAAEPENVEPASVKLVLSKKGMLWIDGEKIGKTRRKTLELDPGTHQIKAKFGRKIAQKEISVEAGGQYIVSIDARRRRIVLKKK